MHPVWKHTWRGDTARCRSFEWTILLRTRRLLLRLVDGIASPKADEIAAGSLGATDRVRAAMGTNERDVVRPADDNAREVRSAHWYYDRGDRHQPINAARKFATRRHVRLRDATSCVAATAVRSSS